MAEAEKRSLIRKMSDVSETVNAEIEAVYQKFGTLEDFDIVALVRKAERENNVFSLPLSREIVREDPTMRNFIRIKTVYNFIDLESEAKEEGVSLISYGDGVDGAKIKASTQAMRNADVYALCEAYKIVLPETKVVSEKKRSEPKAKEVQKATPDQVKMLADFYTGAKLTKLLQINKISRIEDIPRSKAAELISKVYKHE